MTNYRKTCVYTLLAGTALAVSASSALAQTAPAASPSDAQKVQEIIVTGSSLPQSPDHLTVPVSMVGADAIQKTGITTNVLDILQKAVPVFAGRNDIGASNGANNNQRTGGGSSIEVHNLDTLVLVNGHRVAVSAVSGVNGKVFVNVAEIPPDAIDHIEVLTDGASAIYGSDAVGGVVNIILKSDWQGGQVNVQYGGANGYNQRNVGMTFGFDPIKHTNITFSASYNKTDPLFQNQRAFSSPFYSTATNVPGAANGNYYLAPGISTPMLGGGFASPASDPQYLNAGAAIGTAPGTGVGGTYDLSRFGTLLVGQEQKAASMSLNSDLFGDKSVTLFGDFEYADNSSFAQYSPVAFPVSAPAGSPYNPFTNATNVVFGSTANPSDAYTSEYSVRASLGLRGKASVLGRGGNWEVSFTHSQNVFDQTNTNIIYKSNLTAAVAGGYTAGCAGPFTAGGAYSLVKSLSTGANVCQKALNVFAVSSAMDPASLANVLTNETIHGRSSLDVADAKFGGSVLQLPGGPIQYAVGAQWRREAISGSTDPTDWVHVTGVPDASLPNDGQQSLTQGGLNVDPFNASRTITAQYLEVRLPITGIDKHVTGFYAFDVTAAVRHEHYSGVGDSTVPKIGIRWEPVARQITLRGDYSKSFTAPSLYALDGPINLRDGGGGIITNAGIVGGIANPFHAEDGNNPALQPAHATSWDFGAVLKPDFIPGLKIDAEYASVDYKNMPGGIGFNNILNDVNLNGSASPFYNNISNGNFPGFTGAKQGAFATPGALAAYLQNPANSTGGYYKDLYVVDRFTNLGEVNEKYLDITTNYAISLKDKGTISLMNNASFLLSYLYRALPTSVAGSNPATKAYQFAGTTTSGGGSQGTLPRLQMYTTADWSIPHWDVTVANTYISGVSDEGGGGSGFWTGYNKGTPGFVIGHVSPYSTWDLRVAWSSAAESGDHGLTLSAGVNNLMNTMPRVSTNISPSAGASTAAWRNENNADVSMYNPIGRLIYITAGYKF